MGDMTNPDWGMWWTVLGLACLFMGVMINLVWTLPRALRRGPQPSAAPGTPEAFGYFWLDQYAWIGVCVFVIGLFLVTWQLIAG